jgi:hypothetical protein
VICSRCKSDVSFWKRDLLSGLCPKCHAADEAQREAEEAQRQREEEQRVHQEAAQRTRQIQERLDARNQQLSAQSIDHLIFVGLNGYAVALHRDTGEVVWSNNQMNSGFVTILLDGDRLIVSTNGYMYCLNPLTGQILWHNPLTGYGSGAPTAVVSVRGQAAQTTMMQAAAAIAAQRAAASRSGSQGAGS